MKSYVNINELENWWELFKAEGRNLLFRLKWYIIFLYAIFFLSILLFFKIPYSFTIDSMFQDIPEISNYISSNFVKNFSNILNTIPMFSSILILFIFGFEYINNIDDNLEELYSTMSFRSWNRHIIQIILFLIYSFTIILLNFILSLLAICLPYILFDYSSIKFSLFERLVSILYFYADIIPFIVYVSILLAISNTMVFPMIYIFVNNINVESYKIMGLLGFITILWNTISISRDLKVLNIPLIYLNINNFIEYNLEILKDYSLTSMLSTNFIFPLLVQLVLLILLTLIAIRSFENEK